MGSRHRPDGSLRENARRPGSDRARLNALEPKIIRSRRVFTIPQRDLIPEGIAYDPVDDAFYMSSIYRRKVVRIDRDGSTRDFIAEGQDGMMGGLGMKVDPARRLLWVVSAPVPGMRGYTPELDGTGGLFAYDLRTGLLAKKVTVGSRESPAGLNDIAILSDGTVFGTDTFGGAVWHLPPGASSLTTFFPAKSWPTLSFARSTRS